MVLVLGAAWLLSLRRTRRAYEARLRLLAERERVATSLHDTLLQSMQGMILRFQSVSHRLAADHPERVTIEHILDQADEVLAEGRHQILALRMPLVYGDNLSQSLAALGQALQDSYGRVFRLQVHGRPVPVHGDCSEAIYAIMRELLQHLFQQARDGEVALELVYGCAFLELHARDSGDDGAPPPALDQLRARAARLSATIDVMSLPGLGTEAILKVPGAVCYQTPYPLDWQHRFAAWLGCTH
ncbi:hypothetical protein GJ699_16470 [Duganella sp. FT80W]|uniref:Signal transduction histidine kinase subgroup 3 dimerisation and phosphoacceptor domain-containing protein n=1 Tax=Duganella guangzhouensis TaxID=2666084 RepID=A0A6I2L1I5_9BURK|nr:histidine kinase [Duganella guangzhouensis]MRW91590.1 hypothetical protein [Duganella guangzhouensis]